MLQDSQALLEHAIKVGLRPDLDSQKAAILQQTQTLEPQRIIAALASAAQAQAQSAAELLASCRTARRYWRMQ